MNCKTSQVKLPKGTFQQEKTRTTPSGSGTTCAVAGQAISGTRTCMRSPTQRRQRATAAEQETIIFPWLAFSGAIHLPSCCSAPLADLMSTPTWQNHKTEPTREAETMSIDTSNRGKG